MKFQLVDESRSEVIAKLAVCLINEIVERTGAQHFNIDVTRTINLCERFIASERYQVMAAFDGECIVGFAAVCESQSLYAGGRFGVIQELYVLPEYRSQNVGHHLVSAITTLAEEKEWQRLELCTPPVPAFDQTVAFYESNGFEITGGYKMKRIIPSK